MILSKGSLLRVVETQNCLAKGYNIADDKCG